MHKININYMLMNFMEDYNQTLGSNSSSNATNIKEQGIFFYIWLIISYPLTLTSRFVNGWKDAAIVSGVSNLDRNDTLRTNLGSRSKMELKSNKFDI